MRLVARGARGLVAKLDLKLRPYIGPTSLDAELSLVMANLARVAPNALVYDPYCGTASTLVAAAAFGAWTLGADIHRPVLAGDVVITSGPRAKQRRASDGARCRGDGGLDGFDVVVLRRGRCRGAELRERAAPRGSTPGADGHGCSLQLA